MRILNSTPAFVNIASVSAALQSAQFSDGESCLFSCCFSNKGNSGAKARTVSMTDLRTPGK